MELFEHLRFLGLIHSKKDLANALRIESSTLSGAFSGQERRLTNGFFEKICKTYPDIFNVAYFTEDTGEMLKSSYTYVERRKLIPLYDDVSSIGGTTEVASVEGVTQPSEYIDAGDWFKDATAAIRHHGESMAEYKPGCLLALKEVNERQLVVWGKNYVIETAEFRITKRLQRGVDENHIRAYSTNDETYPDGRLIHEPLNIAWKDILKLFLVLGYVVKEIGGTIVYNNSK